MFTTPPQRAGFYLSARLWSHPVGSRGAVMTEVMEPTAADGECLMFWYYMEGGEVGELSVSLQTLGSDSVQLWSRSGDQGRHWRHGRVTLLSPNDPYQVVCSHFSFNSKDNNHVQTTCSFCMHYSVP